MRKASVILLGIGMLAAVAAGDIVYLRNGKSYSGRVTRQGDTVKIDIGAKVLVVPASDVLHITPQKVPDAPAPQPPAPEPVPAASQPAALPAGPATLDDGGLDLTAARTPEPILFSLMRRLAATPAGMESYKVREQIKPWQIAAHEKRRKVDGRWVATEHFTERREAYQTGAVEVEDLAKRINRLRVRSGAQQANKRTLQREHGTRMRELARSWPDEQIRAFLSGIAEYRAENYPAAETLFRRCIEASPHVAGYHQGRAMTLLKLKRGLDALGSALTALRLHPESTTALELVKEAMKQTRGMDTDTDVYRRAKAVTSAYAKDTRRRSTRGTDWLMPGRKAWADLDNSLPIPAYDRLTVRQGIGVPIDDNTLLIDETVIAGAAELIVVTADGQVWPGRLEVPSHTTRGTTSPGVAMVSVEDITFTPVAVPEPVLRSRWSKRATTQAASAPAKLADGQGVQVLTLVMFPEMGTEHVPLAGRLKKLAAADAFELDGVTMAPGDGGGPAMTNEGMLAGFARPRVDPTLDNGGPGGFIGPDVIAPLVARARRGSRSRPRYGFNRATRKVTPVAVKGQWFRVYAIVPERFSVGQ